MIQIGGVKNTIFCQEEGMGGVSRYFSKVSGSGVDLTLLKTKEMQNTKEWKIRV